jgi:hypothetical protein
MTGTSRSIADVKKRMQQDAKESRFVQEKLPDIKAHDNFIAERDDIYNMTLSEFLEWFDTNALHLFKSASYSRIKNHSLYTFRAYVAERKALKLQLATNKTKVALVRRNSKLRTSFTVIDGPLTMFNSTTLLNNSLTIQNMPHALDKDLRFCVQFSGKFTKIADEFCEDIKSEAVYRTLQNVRSTAIYHKKVDTVLTY